MVPERGKLHLPIPAGCLPYPFHRTEQAIQFELVFLPGQCSLSLCQFVLFSGPGSGACFGRTSSPWSGPFPLPPPPAEFPSTLVRRSLRYLWACPTSLVRSSLSYPLGFTARPSVPSPKGESGISRFPCRKFPDVRRVFDHVGPIHPSPYLSVSCCLPYTMTPSAPHSSCNFRGSIPAPPFPLSTLRRYPYEYLRMTRGQCGWLILHCMELSSTTFCRSPGAPLYFKGLIFMLLDFFDFGTSFQRSLPNVLQL